MGYSARYHVASLAAVFLALGVGILIGTGLKSVVSQTTKNLEASLKSDISHYKDQASELRGELADEHAFDQAAYPGLVRGLLDGQRVAVIALGSLSDDLRSDIEQVVGQANITGARVQDFAIVREPPDLHGMAAALSGARAPGLPTRHLARGDNLSRLATRAGRALVGGRGLLARLRGTLFSHRSGGPAGIDAVIVTRQQPTSLDPAQADATNRLEAGLLAGLLKSGLPVVGVERSDTQPSSIGLFQSQGLASVDDLDTYAGRIALVYALRGTQGSFGTKATADRLLPRLRRPSTHPPASRILAPQSTHLGGR